MDLVRKILIDTAEGVSDYYLQLGRFADADVEKVRLDEKIIYHIKIMCQKGLLTFKTMDELEGDCKIFDVELTWEGQDYLSAIEDDTIWNKTKGIVKEKGLELTKIPFDVIKNIAIQQTKKMFGIE